MSKSERGSNWCTPEKVSYLSAGMNIEADGSTLDSGGRKDADVQQKAAKKDLQIDRQPEEEGCDGKK
jgi:hypothetical protein